MARKVASGNVRQVVDADQSELVRWPAAEEAMQWPLRVKEDAPSPYFLGSQMSNCYVTQPDKVARLAAAWVDPHVYADEPEDSFVEDANFEHQGVVL